MDTIGRHLLVEYRGCNFDALNDVQRVQALMESAALAAKATIITSVFTPFDPQGVSGVVVVSESHLSIHTWPEQGYAAVDFYTCGCSDPHAAHQVLKDGLEADSYEMLEVERGLNTDPRGTQCMMLLSTRFRPGIAEALAPRN